jgi:hypothetical protein
MYCNFLPDYERELQISGKNYLKKFSITTKLFLDQFRSIYREVCHNPKKIDGLSSKN